MDSNSYNSIHIVTESVIMGAVSMYFYKKISDLETIVKDLQQQVVELKSSSVVSPPHEGALQIPSGSGARCPQKTLLHIPTPQPLASRDPSSLSLPDCSDGVCKLVSGGKKVVISKISKQAEFDRESFQVNHPLKVETFKRTSPNPIIKSVTPKPSEETVEQILNEINNE